MEFLKSYLILMNLYFISHSDILLVSILFRDSHRLWQPREQGTLFYACRYPVSPAEYLMHNKTIHQCMVKVKDLSITTGRDIVKMQELTTNKLSTQKSQPGLHFSNVTKQNTQAYHDHTCKLKKQAIKFRFYIISGHHQGSG